MIMAAKYKVLRYSRKTNNGVINSNMVLDLSRFGKQISTAQFNLDSMVMTDMVPFMPMQTGLFIDVTRAMSASYAGTGTVVAAAPPFGRFLYEGKTMVDIQTGSPWARRGAKKVLVSQYSGKTNARPNLTYSNGRSAHWFDKAKKQRGDEWIRETKKTAGGGR
jgi:hypothetical protein